MKIDLLDQIENQYLVGVWISGFEMKSVENLIWKWLEFFVGNFQDPLPGCNVHFENMVSKS
jgi:hypothetical protein